MQKIVFIMVCFLTAFILSCGSSETEQSCVTAFDCPDGKICSDGFCIDKNTSGGTSEDDVNGGEDVSDGNSELPDAGNDVHDGEKNDSDNPTDTPETPDAPDTPNDSDAENPETPDTPNDDDADTPETPDTPNDNDSTEPVSDSDIVSDNDTEPVSDSDIVSDNDTEPVSDSDNMNDNDTEPVSDSDNINDNDAEIIDDSDSETNEDDPHADWDTSPDDEVCPYVMNECINPITDFGCLPEMASEFPDHCDGIDNDCDGKIDEGCFCVVGQIQPCFGGKPNQRNVGICQDGIQTCAVGSDGKTGTWGECTGGILPHDTDDICDKADNDCNGCIDDGLCCHPPIDCSYDIGTAQPFTDKIIDGNQIYDIDRLFNDAETAHWEWTLTKGPCDIVLNKTSFTTKGAATSAGLSGAGAASTTVSGTGLSWFKVNFQLSGTYLLHLKVTRTNGEVYECEWPLKVISDGLRIELCWDTTGDIDVDLHVGKNGVTSSWTNSSACYYNSCQTAGYNNSDAEYPYEVSGWSYAATNSSTPNPRLDIDNITTVGKPENINIDNPNNNDTFRVLVRYFQSHYCSSSWNCFWGSYDDIVTHPVVNVYCGGTLKATYGVSPQYTLSGSDDSWKVVEIKWVGDVASDECELTPNLGISYDQVPNYSSW